MREIPLCDMEKGQKGTVTALKTEGNLRKRLQDLGLLEGTPVDCVRESPLGDPKAYRVRDSVMALRKEDAGTVWVEVEP